MLRILLFVCALLSIPRRVWGFCSVQQVNLLASSLYATQNQESNPFREVDVDLDKARDYANHFGKYPAKDVEKMRDDLHAHRIQTMVMTSSSPTAPEAVFEEKALEDELNTQLNLLKEEYPDPYLFPQALESDEMAELPHMTDGTPAEKLREEKDIAMFEELAEEGVLESLAMCGIIGMLMMAPQFL